MQSNIRRNSIRARITIAFIVSAIFPMVLVGAILGWQSYRVQSQQALDFESQVAQRVATEVDAFFQELVSELRSVIEVQGLLGLDADQQEAALFELLSYTDLFGELILLDERGQEQSRLSRVAVFTPDDLDDRSQADEFVIPKASGETYYSPVRFDAGTGEPLMIIAVPLVDLRSGQVRGVLVADARLRKIWDLIRDVHLNLGENVYIVEEQGRVIAHHNFSVVLRGTRFDLPDQDGVHIGLEGARVVLATDSVKYGEQSFIVVAERAISEAYALVNNTMIILALLVVGALVLATGQGFLTIRQIVRPVEALATAAQAISAGDLSQRVLVTSRDEFGDLAQAFNTMSTQLDDLITGLEQRVAERTLALEQRSAYLEGSAEVGRAAASILDVDILIHQVVELIRERFDLYYVGLFLVEADADIGGADAGHADIGGADVAGGEWAVLRAGTGEAGRTMLARGHRLRVGTGMIGWSVANAEARIALDVGADAVHFDNPDLPNTHSEGALPLISRGRVLGALTVQSDQPDAFDAAAISVLQMMADQVAMALDNAQLLAASQTALEAERRAYGEISREAWRELLHTRTQWGYRYARQSVMPAERIERPEMLEAERTGQSVRKNGAPPGGGEEGATLVVPIKAFDEVIGTLRFCRSEMWGVEETALLETLTAQLSMALESARLHQDAQNRAAREQLTREITTRMRESLEVDTVLQTAVREIGDALGITKIKLRMSTR